MLSALSLPSFFKGKKTPTIDEIINILFLEETIFFLTRSYGLEDRARHTEKRWLDVVDNKPLPVSGFAKYRKE